VNRRSFLRTALAGLAGLAIEWKLAPVLPKVAAPNMGHWAWVIADDDLVGEVVYWDSVYVVGVGRFMIHPDVPSPKPIGVFKERVG
jgi:hypothetical protein